MNILWITNIVFPEAQSLVSGKGMLRGSGGWLLSSAEQLVTIPSIRLTVASISKDVRKLTYVEGKNICYYLLPYGKGNYRRNHDYEALWVEVRDRVNPDVIHIHGTEFTHGLAYIDACGVEKVCVSIQGIIRACGSFYSYGLSNLDILKSTTIASLVRGGILTEKKSFVRRGRLESELICRVNHIIGRTTWDKANILSLNPNVNYYYCGETLRPEFYNNHTWSYKKCNAHSIFLSQASYPLKGLHMVLRAMPLVLNVYPDAKIRIAGRDITSNNSIKDKLLLRDYGNLIRKLVKKMKLQEVVSFTGPLNVNEMICEYLKCNVFICPSSVENSPNSLGEAQILGVPCLSSYAGGIVDMMNGDETHLYRYEDVEVLAHKICLIFEEGDKVNTDRMQKKAIIRHDPHSNLSDLLKIYTSIIEHL